MSDQQQKVEPKLSRTPSESEEDSDRGGLSAFQAEAEAVTVSQEENDVQEVNRDPPAMKNSSFGDMTDEREDDSWSYSAEGSLLDRHGSREHVVDATPLSPMNLVLEGMPRVTEGVHVHHHQPLMSNKATRGRDDEQSTSQNEREQVAKHQVVSSTTDEKTMAPNIRNDASLPDRTVEALPEVVVPEEEIENAPDNGESAVDKPFKIGQGAFLPPSSRPVVEVSSSEAPSPLTISMPSILRTGDQHHVPQHIPVQHRVPQQLAPVAYGYAHIGPSPYATPPPFSLAGGRRKIKLRLEEDIRVHERRQSFFARRFSHRRIDSAQSVDSSVGEQGIDRGSISVSWFEGTTSAELQEHVRKSLIRKVGLRENVKLVDLRILDETVDPPEEIVLSPFIPNGSRFLLRYSTKEREEDTSYSFGPGQYLNNQIASTAPASPSAAPSPYPSTDNLLNLNDAQLQILGAKLKELSAPTLTHPSQDTREATEQAQQWNRALSPARKVSNEGGSRSSADFEEEEVMSMHPDDQIEARLRQLTDLLVTGRREKRDQVRSKDASMRRKERKQVIFVMANYFVLFLSVIAIMAEIQSRAPRWLEWAERNLESVQTCATDQESLFECVSSGDFSGLIASFVLWFGRSAATRRFFLFGFETPKRLWTVVYEAMVTAFCWSISYMFIRRGMNPDTRQNFIAKYWKDAVYGSLAGFNASFLKAVLKNLVPEEAVEHALQERQLKILSWFPNWH